MSSTLLPETTGVAFAEKLHLLAEETLERLYDQRHAPYLQQTYISAIRKSLKNDVRFMTVAVGGSKERRMLIFAGNIYTTVPQVKEPEEKNTKRQVYMNVTDVGFQPDEVGRIKSIARKCVRVC